MCLVVGSHDSSAFCVSSWVGRIAWFRLICVIVMISGVVCGFWFPLFVMFVVVSCMFDLELLFSWYNCPGASELFFV